jgi:hypothetical protein
VSTGREGVPATEEDTRDESTEQAAAERIIKRSRGNAGWVAFSSFVQARIGCSDRDTGENRDGSATGSNELLQRRILHFGLPEPRLNIPAVERTSEPQWPEDLSWFL